MDLVSPSSWRPDADNDVLSLKRYTYMAITNNFLVSHFTLVAVLFL
jgi:hypothetical protein